MKQTTKNILGVGAIILLSSGVAGLTIELKAVEIGRS